MRHSKGARLVDVASCPELRVQPAFLVALKRALNHYMSFRGVDIVREKPEQTAAISRSDCTLLGITFHRQSFQITVHAEINAFQWLSPL